MPRKRQKFCPNCKGTNKKCKYLINSRICEKGKAIGKAKGKAISQATIDKRDNYDSQLGDLHTDYLNDMANRQIKVIYDDENGEKKVLSRNNNVYSFERWLNLKGHKKLAMWFRRNFTNHLEDFNFKDFIK